MPLREVGTDAWAALTEGKPKADWSELECPELIVILGLMTCSNLHLTDAGA